MNRWHPIHNVINSYVVEKQRIIYEKFNLKNINYKLVFEI